MLVVVGSQWASLILRIASALALTPFLIGSLGAEGYGIWILLNAVLGYLSLLQAGLPASSLRHLSENLADEGYEGFNRTVASVLALFGTIAAIVLLAGGALVGIFELFYDVPARWALDGRTAFGLATLAIAITLINNPLMTIMEAHGGYLGRNLIQMIGTVLRTALTIGLVMWQPSLTMVALATLCAELAILICAITLLRRHYPEVRLGIRARDRTTMRSLINFSMVVFLLSLGSRLAYQTDGLVIGLVMPMAAISVYSIANTLALYLSELVNSVAEPLMPRATQLRLQGSESELQVLFLLWSKISVSIALLIGLFLLFLGPAFIAWWINPEFGDQAEHVLQILVLSFIVMLLASAVGLRFLLGLTRPLTLAVAHLLAGGLNLALSLLLVRPYGLIGVAIGTAVPNVLLAVIILRLSCSATGVSMSRYLSYAIMKPFLAAVIVGGFLYFLEHALPVQTMAGLVAAGILHVLVFSILWVFFVYRKDPYLDLYERLRAALMRVI